MQIVKNIDQDLLSEIGLKINDPEFKEFQRPIYAQAVFRAQRKIARQYNILERRFEGTTDGQDVSIGYLILPKDFEEEFLVTINNIQYTKNSIELRATEDDLTIKVDGETIQIYTPDPIPLQQYEYKIYFDEQKQHVLKYNNMASGDTFKILYTSLSSFSEEYDGLPYLPDKFYEEIIRQSILYISEIGIARFQEKMKQKYLDLYKLYSSINNMKDSNLLKNEQWIEIKPFRFP